MSLIVAVDFDGTVVMHEYPKVGVSIGAVPWLKQAMEDFGVKLVLWTMRDGKELADAIDWFKLNKLDLWGIQTNPEQRVWTQSPKAYCQLYIDDCGLGAPLIKPAQGKPYIDWSIAGPMLINHCRNNRV